MTGRVILADTAFDPAAELAAFTAGLDGEGAVVSFTGHARAHARDGSAVGELVLEAYRSVTLASMQAIAASLPHGGSRNPGGSAASSGTTPAAQRAATPALSPA